MKGYEKSVIRNISTLIHLSNGVPLTKSQYILISQGNYAFFSGGNSDESIIEIHILEVQSYNFRWLQVVAVAQQKYYFIPDLLVAIRMEAIQYLLKVFPAWFRVFPATGQRIQIPKHIHKWIFHQRPPSCLNNRIRDNSNNDELL
jgi:hypothetical protein